MNTYQQFQSRAGKLPIHDAEVLRHLRERFGEMDFPDLLHNETLRLQLQHRSVRKFLSDSISEEALDIVLRAGQSASHSSNLQAWSVVVVKNQERRRRISDAIGTMAFIEKAPVFLVWVIDLRRAAHILERQGKEMETIRYLEGALVPFVDVGIAAQNTLLAAESLGLGGVYVGALRNNPLAIMEELKLPEFTFPAIGMSLGYPNPDEAAGIKPRLATSAVVHDETYSDNSWHESVDEYEKRLASYFERFGVDDYSWFRRVAERLGPRSGLKGRHQLREWLQSQGFPCE